MAQFIVFANKAGMPEICGMVQKHPKRKLKIIKLPEVLQAKKTAVANYQREKEISKENHLILTKLWEELLGSFQSTCKKVLFINSFT